MGGKPQGKKPLGNMRRWENKMDFGHMGCEGTD